jgi:hypothetical protein
MGVGKRFLKHFGPATTEACPWLVDEKSDDTSAQAFYNVYTELVRQLRREESLSLLRTLKRDFYIPLPRIRPGGSSAGSRSTANRSAAASGHRRNNTYTNKVRRPVTHPDKGDRTAVHAGRRPPYRTQHRANPHHTGRRS